jgi:hypothetical protein
MEKVKIGELVFDAILKTDHNSKLAATSHPIESGANIADHAFVEPAEVSIELAVSDSETGKDTFGSGDRSVNAFGELLKLQTSRKLITVSTRFKVYNDMLIMSVSVPDDYTTMNAFKAMVMLREIKTVSTSKVSVTQRATSGSSQVQKSGSTSSGTKQPDAPKQSVLKQISNMLKGDA